MATPDRNFLAAVVEESEDSIVTIDLNCIITTWNKAAERIYGYPKTEAVGQHLSILSFPEEFESSMDSIRRVQAGAAVERREIDRRRKDGTRLAIAVQFSPIHDPMGHLIGVSTISRDITERKRHLEERQRLFDVAADLLLIAGFDGTIKWVSPNWERTTGWTLDELQAQPWINFLHPDDHLAAFAAAEQARAGQDVPRVESRYRTKEGAYLWLSWKVRPYPDDKLIYAAAANVDLRRRTEEELKASEQRFRKLFTSAAVGLALVDLRKRFHRVNTTYCNITGYTEEELLQRSIIDIHHPDDAPFVIDQLRRLQNRELTNYDSEKRYIRKDGEVVWVRANVTLLLDSQNQPTHFFGAVQDVTDRKRLEHALRRNEEHLRVIFETAKDFAILTMDVEGRILTWNTGAEETFGFTAKEALNRNVDDDIFVPEDVDAGVPKQERITATQTGMALDERWHRRKNGERFFASGAMRPMFDENSKLQGYVKICRDITSRKHMETELRTAHEDLEKTVQRRTRELQTKVSELEAFSYTVSHDLRAPLRAMQAFTTLLLDDHTATLSEEGKDYLQRIKASADRLDVMIQDILAYSRMARVKIELAPIVLDELITDVLNTFANIQSANAVVETIAPLGTVIAHRASLVQCLSNLISNALKFVPAGTKPSVQIWTEPVNGKIKIFVKDNGIGIAPEYQAKIFNIFETLHRADRYEGTGIGLAIVSKAVERMGGQVGVQSEVGKGSTFWIELAAARSQ